jgi:hypothetical protein
MTLHSVGTWLSLVIVLVIALAIAGSFAMNEAAEDLRLQVRVASAQQLDRPRTVWGSWLSARVAADVDRSDVAALNTRIDELDRRADRIRELSSAASLGVLVLLLVSARPEARVIRSAPPPRQS